MWCISVGVTVDLVGMYAERELDMCKGTVQGCNQC